MKKRFIITGMITIWGMINLTLTSNLSWGSGTQSSTVQTPPPFSEAEYLKIIDLLKQQIKANEDQIENTKKVYQSITGNKKIDRNELSELLLKHSPFYPPTDKTYKGLYDKNFKGHSYFEKLMTETNADEWRVILPVVKHNIIYDKLNERLQYSGIIDKAVSLQTFQDAENRFTQIAGFLKDIDKTKDLREVFDLQTRIRNMSAVLQNEYTKLQMVRNLSNNEEFLIEMQKRILYKRIMNNALKRIPRIRF
ncbi:type IV secretion system protein [Bartonella taylorii]|uniref:type IV secretion system protein n=1 Tax=Bartonella taylorii TaxID=33046 RepID=UPI001ABA25DF|nr:type IV secretion system protein [Bartonella taylorii]